MHRKSIVLILVGVLMSAGCSGGGDDSGFGGGGDGPGGGGNGLRVDGISVSSAAPGETVILYGEGLDATTDEVMVGDQTIVATVSSNAFLSGLMSSAEPDAIDGQVPFTVPAIEAGSVSVKVLRETEDGILESNTVELVIDGEAVVGDDDDDDDDDGVTGGGGHGNGTGTQTGDDDDADVFALNVEFVDQTDHDRENGRNDRGVYRVSWFVPEGQEAIVYVPTWLHGMYHEDKDGQQKDFAGHMEGFYDNFKRMMGSLSWDGNDNGLIAQAIDFLQEHDGISYSTAGVLVDGNPTGLGQFTNKCSKGVSGKYGYPCKPLLVTGEGSVLTYSSFSSVDALKAEMWAPGVTGHTIEVASQEFPR